MARRFENKVAIVTGAASGIGLATAQRLVAEGARVAVWDRHTNDTVERLGLEQGAAGVFVEQLDVTDAPAVHAAVTRLIGVTNHLDILVNCAGVTYGYVDALRLSDAAWRSHWETNVTGALYCTQAAVPRMKAAGAGRIINLGSILAAHGFPGQSAYAASKAALLALTRVWAREFAPFGITVNAVSPGYIQTSMNRANPADFVKLVIGRTPLRRLGTADEVAAVITFLASDEASFVTGAVLPVDGGLSA